MLEGSRPPFLGFDCPYNSAAPPYFYLFVLFPLRPFAGAVILCALSLAAATSIPFPNLVILRASGEDARRISAALPWL
jgi:hypothetical protein